MSLLCTLHQSVFGAVQCTIICGGILEREHVTSAQLVSDCMNYAAGLGWNKITPKWRFKMHTEKECCGATNYVISWPSLFPFTCSSCTWVRLNYDYEVGMQQQQMLRSWCGGKW